MRSRLALVLLVLGATGCAALAPPPPFVPPAPAVHADVAEVEWLVGRWRTDARDFEESWQPAGDALLGASFTVADGRTSTWEASIIARDEQGRLTYRAMPEGADPVAFVRNVSGDRAVRFGNPSHDFPQLLAYARRDAGSVARLGARIAGGGRQIDLPMLLVASAPAPELEEADRAFAADVDSRGADAWVEVFDEAGGMESDGKRVAGKDAIRAAMTPLLSDRKARLQWAPLASGLSPAGDLGYTVGAWALRKYTDGTWRTHATGSYVTVWRRAADGAWKVLFDAGEDDPPPPANP
ncbi:MAG: DUF6265 family protein [bacterium]